MNLSCTEGGDRHVWINGRCLDCGIGRHIFKREQAKRRQLFDRNRTIKKRELRIAGRTQTAEL